MAERRTRWEARGWRAPPASLFPRRMRWRSPAASLVPPTPSELVRTQDEDGGTDFIIFTLSRAGQSGGAVDGEDPRWGRSTMDVWGS